VNKTLKVGALLVLSMGCAAAASPVAAGPADTLRRALEVACDPSSSEAAAIAGELPGATAVHDEPLRARGVAIGWERHFRLAGGAEIRLERIAPDGTLRRLKAEYWRPAPDGGVRPRLALVADGGCSILLGRRMAYETNAQQPTAVEHLDASLKPTGVREPLNPPVSHGEDPGGVPVALVDAGVNYLLPAIERRLARDASGAILGYDYWDLDRRPFDTNPARSPFFPQRHGTRTASLLLEEAPMVRLVPYRYPRPAMERMKRLVRDAAAKGIRVMNLSMGSDEVGDWEAFADAARAHPDMLFVLSAGNNGRDIDERPVYPAAMPLDNAITVTSSDTDGMPAPGSNRGRRAVDLLVPAERLRVTGFDGKPTVASGSSYAAVRITALAARLLAMHPEWDAGRLRSAIFARVLPDDFFDRPLPVRRGFMPRPDKAEHLPAPLEAGSIETISRHSIDPAQPAAPEHRFKLTFAFFEDTTWTPESLRRHVETAAGILAGCGITITDAEAHLLDGPATYRYFHNAIARDLVARVGLEKPTVYFVKDTLQVHPYDAEAIGKSNSARRPGLRYTVWMTEATRHPGIALAHELAHLLMNSGEHVQQAGNLMRAETEPDNTALKPAQCAAMARAGTANGLLSPVDDRSKR